MAAIAGRVRLVRALRHRPFALLWFGQTISRLGDGAYYTALAWLILLLTGSATAMGIVVTAGTIPNVLFLLLGGVAADRLPRRLVMLWSDIGRGVLMLLITVLAWTHLLQVWHLVVLSICFGFVDGFFFPAYQSIPPQLVPTEDLASSNALTGLSQNVSQLIGPLLGAGLVALVGPYLAFGFDGLTFAVSALCLFALRLPSPETLAAISPATTASAETNAITEASEETSISEAGTPSVPASEEPARRKGIAGVMQDLREGIRYTLSSTWIWVTIVIASAGNIFLVAPLVVGMPKLVRDAYGSGVWLLGVLEAAGSVGSIIGILIVGQMKHMSRRGIKAYLTLIGTGVALVAMGWPLPRGIEIYVAIPANALLGFAIGFFNVIWFTVLQELIPADKLGRVSSIDMMGSFVLTPIGYALGGVVIDQVGPRLVFIGCGIISALMPTIGLAVKGIRALD